MKFCTVINCMDGRVQLPVIDHLRGRFGAEYVDVVTEAGPVGILSSQSGSGTAESIFARVDVSVEKHLSNGIAVAAHYDCAGNPVSESTQMEQLRECLRLVSTRYPHLEVIGLWVDAKREVSEIGPGD